MSNGWFYNQNMLRRYPELLANYPNLDGDTAALGLIKHMGVLPGLRLALQGFETLLAASERLIEERA